MRFPQCIVPDTFKDGVGLAGDGAGQAHRRRILPGEQGDREVSVEVRDERAAARRARRCRTRCQLAPLPKADAVPAYSACASSGRARRLRPVTSPPEIVLDADAIARIIRRMASEIIERTRGCERLGLVGIQRGGTPIAAASGRRRSTRPKARDSAGRRARHHAVPRRRRDRVARSEGRSEPHRVATCEDGDVVLVDDVLHTGRTVRAAIDCLLDYGRPRRIWLAVLCDRGGRQLPIAADFVGPHAGSAGRASCSTSSLMAAQAGWRVACGRRLNRDTEGGARVSAGFPPSSPAQHRRPRSART